MTEIEKIAKEFIKEYKSDFTSERPIDVTMRSLSNAFNTEVYTYHSFGLTRAKYIQELDFMKTLVNDYDKHDQLKQHITPLSFVYATRLDEWKAVWEMPKEKGLYVLAGREMVFIPRYTFRKYLHDMKNKGFGGQWVYASPRWRNIAYNAFLKIVKQRISLTRRAPLISATFLAIFSICPECYGRGRYDWISRTSPTNGRKEGEDVTKTDVSEGTYILAKSANVYYRRPFIQDSEHICEACDGLGVDLSNYKHFENGYLRDGSEEPIYKTHGFGYNFSYRVAFVTSSQKRSIELKDDDDGKYKDFIRKK
jgi:hypothetical protein